MGTGTGHVARLPFSASIGDLPPMKAFPLILALILAGCAPATFPVLTGEREVV
jgi:hypothetical protein